MICTLHTIKNNQAVSTIFFSAARLVLTGLAISALLLGCTDQTPVFHAEDNPQRLSDWNLFELTESELIPSDKSLVFRPANQLFTDYAQKLRTLWIPDGRQASLLDNEIDYPVGTVVSKTFYYPANEQGELLKETDLAEHSIELARNRLIETRLLVRRETGWDAFPYVWNEQQSEAFLRLAGTSTAISLKSDTGTLDFSYFVPNENQCGGCHVISHPDGEMLPLGAIARQLTSRFSESSDSTLLQIDAMLQRGWLTARPDHAIPESWRDESAELETRATAYLNMQCGHCHNPQGAADTSSLILDGSHSFPVNMGVCKAPVAAGGGAGDMLYSIVPGAPERSILLYRMLSNEPDEMMPELGRSLVHSEGIALISRWIEQLQGSCQ
ncbi:MAG: SO2930 family diheme c-type cytochrome [Gammaproteobacteria bacterium]|jgi:uncharacterized repeat protein (TIGR03806 family)|nr:SO2930 family diheme c-type cytochrome [Gammaproteobacteria bacterium]MDP6732839.1 SO2930 family diheme c-type cytochrome [Gammaproteobacteria bacterium]